MKTQILALLILLGTCAALPATAAPFSAAPAILDGPELMQVANKKTKKKYKNYKYAKDEPYIPGHVRTPYGYRDCIGWWERLSDGRMLCHGQLIRDD
jgi:hypothetical protein